MRSSQARPLAGFLSTQACCIAALIESEAIQLGLISCNRAERQTQSSCKWHAQQPDITAWDGITSRRRTRRTTRKMRGTTTLGDPKRGFSSTKTVWCTSVTGAASLTSSSREPACGLAPRQGVRHADRATRRGSEVSDAEGRMNQCEAATQAANYEGAGHVSFVELARSPRIPARPALSSALLPTLRCATTGSPSLCSFV